ncbi:UNVERIFIED_CONTAM: hypothetical protein Sangu_1183200, partial [Sesamum angustifolium]
MDLRARKVTRNSIPEIELPRFDGEVSRSWIRKCIRYFHIVHTIPKELRVSLAFVHFERKAKLWFQGFWKKKYAYMATIAMYERFGGNDFRRIHQTGATIKHYGK